MPFLSRLKRIFGSKARLGLVLGSGGARGLAHIGVLKALEEAHVPLHCIVGASAGALVGGLYSAGTSPAAMEEMVLRLSRTEIAKLFFPTFNRGGLISGSRIKKFIEPYIAGKKIEDLSPVFACVATDLRSGDRVVFKSGDLLESIRASISIPGLFAPAICGDRTLLDGGVVDPLPIGLAFELGAEFVIAVRVGRQKIRDISETKDSACVYEDQEHKGAVPAIIETVLSALSIYEQRLSEISIREAKNCIIVEPVLEGIEILDFHKGRQAMDAGEAAMRARMPELGNMVPER